ncbi:MAG: flagellin FliC, partial [Burkholderiaceae bacterium]|nr:flagellin FliC [Burkholderiaceae bacterium]
TNSAADIRSIQEEVGQRLTEIDRVASQTDFNGTKVLNVSAGVQVSIQVGANDNEAIGFNISGASAGALLISAFSVTNGNLTTLDAAIAKVDKTRSSLGTIQNRLQSAVANLNNTINNLSAARSRIEDSDYAIEVSNMTRGQILQQAGTSVLAQSNQIPQSVLSLLQ